MTLTFFKIKNLDLGIFDIKIKFLVKIIIEYYLNYFPLGKKKLNF